MPVIQTGNLVKTYGKVEALKGVSLQVEQRRNLSACSGKTAPARPR